MKIEIESYDFQKLKGIQMTVSHANDPMFFFGHSEVGQLAKSIDWSKHPLGPVENWSRELKTAISIVVGSKFPMFISWGKERFFFYNDSYAVILGKKHPSALGSKFFNVWSEIWTDIEPLIHSVDRGEAVYLEDLKLIMNRYGRDEETYFTFSYSPLLSESGSVEGLYCACVETTSRKNAEDSLRLERTKLRTLFSQAPYPIAMLEGPEHRFAYTNPQYDRYFLGGSSKTGKTVLEVLPEAKDQGFIDILDNVFKTGERFIGNEVKFEHIGANGTKQQFYLNFVYEPIRDSEGKVEGILAAISDVTRLVEARKLAEESEARLKTFAETLPQMAWRTEPNGWATYFNMNWPKKTGTSMEENMGEGWVKVIHPDDLPMTLEQWHSALEGKSEYNTEYRVKMADGSYRWHIARAVPIKNDAGNIVEWIGTTTDIEDQKRARIEFERSVDVSPAILWITDKDGSCSYLSKQWFEFTGQTEEEALGFGWLSATHPDDKERTAEVYMKANAAQKPFYAEYRLRTKSGDYRWAIDAGNPRFDSRGNYIGYAGTVFDIHDLKMFEAELKEAVLARDEFLSIASHELKTPLTSLRIQAQLHQRMIRKKDPNAYSPENVNGIIHQTEKQVSRLTRLVDDMLDVSRIRSGNLNVKRERFNLGELADEVVERLRGQFESGSSPMPEVTLKGDTNGNWDRLRIEQVITNLLTNAIRYGNKKPIALTVESLGQNVRLAVKDQGIGIEESQRDKIFGRFERLVDANEVSGLGLGLFISKQIVIAHNGKIWFESEPGKGSTFFVELPKEEVRNVM